LNKYLGQDNFTIYLVKVLVAWIFNDYVNCGTPYEQPEMNALSKYIQEPVSSEISDITPYTDAHISILHVKYTEKTDD